MEKLERADLRELLKQRTREVEAVIERYLPEEEGYQRTIFEAMNYSVRAGGKRLRPMLMQETYRLFGGCGQEIEPFMAAIEMIHTSSLIHDDLPCMDNDELRRGVPTTWVKYGYDMAVLAGDGLLTHAFIAALEGGLRAGVQPNRAAEAALILAQGAGIDGMLGGQIMDLAMEGKKVEAELHQRMCAMKTGALIRSACLMGCALGAAGPQGRKITEEYADKIGLSFQMIDDILDCTGQQELLGKPVGSDAQQNKTTYVTLYGLERAKEMSQRQTEEALECLERLPLPDRFLAEFTEMLLARKF